MPLVALGLNHQTAPLALRELLAFAPEQSQAALNALKSLAGVREAAILSTCNRTELYCQVDEGGENILAEWLHGHFGLSAGRLESYLYRHREHEAARHIFRVATGLDSMILGEPQVLGQLKAAYQSALSAGALDTRLNRLFQNAFAVAKRARTETRIGSSPVSVAFAAVRLASQIFADLRKATVLLIGAGDTIELAARHLLDAGVHRLLVANRTLANAQTLAETYGAQALALSDLPIHLADADIVISSTASRAPVVPLDMVEAALRARRRRPMFMLDLAVPRDIAEAVGALEDVYLYTVDDVGRLIDESMRSRQEAAVEAEAIISLQVDQYMNWCQALDYQGPLKALRSDGEAQRDQVLERARQMLRNGQPAEDVLQFMAHTLTNKLLHGPSSRLRDAALRGDAELIRAGERLFAAAPDKDSKTP